MVLNILHPFELMKSSLANCLKIARELVRGNLEKLHEHGDGDGHHECPCVDQQVCRSVAEIRFTDGTVLDVVLEDGAGVKLAALLRARACD